MTIAIALRRPGLCPRAAPRRTSLSSVGPDKSPFPSCSGGPGRGLPPQIGTLPILPPQAGEGVTTSSAARSLLRGICFPVPAKKFPVIRRNRESACKPLITLHDFRPSPSIAAAYQGISANFAPSSENGIAHNHRRRREG